MQTHSLVVRLSTWENFENKLGDFFFGILIDFLHLGEKGRSLERAVARVVISDFTAVESGREN
jgi:hypothetical protein